MPPSALDGRRPGRLAGLPRRIALTYRYHGLAGLARHTVMFPLRLTGLDGALGLGTGPRRASAAARRWYRDHGRPVTIVIPSFRDAALVSRLVAKIRATTPADRVRIVVADDASGSEHLAALARIDGVDVIAGETNGGFAVNVNRGLRAADPEHDVVLLNSDCRSAARLARLPPARRQRRSAGRDRRRQAAVPGQSHSVRRHDPQRAGAGMV